MSRIFIRNNSSSALKKTALYDLHVKLGATMVPFAGYSMPVLYSNQTHIQSHLWTRQHAGLFDVSHMLQSKLAGSDAINFLHKVTPTDFSVLPAGQGSLSVLLLPKTGGVVDDTIVTKETDSQFYIVTNAGCIDQDVKFFTEQLETSGLKDVSWKPIEGKSLLALQGPTAHHVFKKLLKSTPEDVDSLYFGHRRAFQLNNGVDVEVARGGYTGEDGFEISIDNKHAAEFAEMMLHDSECEAIGLAARDSLRLEAGMCLYGHELNTGVTPVEASLNWVISKSRRAQGGFNGYEKIMDQINNKTYQRVRVGFKYLGRGPAARTDIPIYDAEKKTQVGVVTSGSASPSLGNINIGQGFVAKGLHKKGTPLFVQIRNKFYPIEIVKMPMVPTHYYKQ